VIRVDLPVDVRSRVKPRGFIDKYKYPYPDAGRIPGIDKLDSKSGRGKNLSNDNIMVK